MLITHKIENTHFSASEAVIISYILEQGENIKNMSISQIAQSTFTSAPLLIRIAKKLGYSGWNAFKEDYLKELDYLYSCYDVDASIPFVVGDNFTTIAHNIATLQIETIQDTISLLNHDSLYAAMRALRNAENIDVYGVSNKMLFAQLFSEEMFLIHKNVRICHLTSNAKIQAMMSNEKHCAILISYSGQTEFVIKIANILKENHTPVIALTSIGDNELSKIADVVLHISSREMLNTKIGDFASSLSVKSILDILYACMFSLDYQKNLNQKIDLAKQSDDRVSGFEYIDE